ncbi:MAG: hypothetical protein LBK99_02245 [Opitutaceae bacterium]|jgi:hypothetical protein|nr:hypothetical protein [Opitutaceae bacterium]
MHQPITITHPALLLGEGVEEQRLFSAFLRHLEREDSVQILPYEGKNNLRSFLKALPAVPGFARLRSLAITRDADTDFAAAASSVTDAIAAAAAGIPGHIRISTFILPGPGRTGALEDLCLDAIRDLPAWECAKALATCVNHQRQQQGAGAAPSPAEEAKRQLRAWLCTLPQPGIRLGDAALAGHLPMNAPAFAALREFLAAI